ncbi:acyltransferase family protein, partial [Pseudomonas helleri]
LTPIDYKTLGKHAAGSIGFISNIMYLTEAGYFDSASHEKWLLHTWSLSVEWQFYIIYPLAIIALRKIYTENSVKKLLIFFTGTGFALCVFATYKWPSAAYYLLPTRAWEMMIGGLAYLYPLNPKEKNKKAIEWLGITSIAASYLFINKNTPWPGYLSILPALGSYLIIQANRENSIITGNLAFQKIGSWSYSIYLWHWPLVVAILYFHLSNNYSYLGLALSLLLGFMSYKYIEKNKLIKKTNTIKDFLKAKQTQIALAILAIAIVILTNNGFTNRFNYINNIETLASNRDSSEKYYRQNLMKAFSNNGESFKDSFLCTLDGGRQKTNTAIE